VIKVTFRSIRIRLWEHGRLDDVDLAASCGLIGRCGRRRSGLSFICTFSTWGEANACDYDLIEKIISVLIGVYL
jgi:hypothetical protein